MRTDFFPDLRSHASARPGPATSNRSDGSDYRPLKCRGEAMFASAMAVDMARLLDVDPDVDHWSCGVPIEGGARLADFVTYGTRGKEHLILQSTTPSCPDPACLQTATKIVTRCDIDPIRLENAKLILPFARWRVSLDDRVRLLAVLDEEGSVTLAECLGILCHTSRPVAAVAALALARVVDMDLDEPIGSRTRVIRRET